MDSLIKSKHPKNFTAVDNDFIRDERLSWKAKGIIIYVMSLPDDWRLYISELSKHAKDGRDSTYRGINELIEFGYCKRTELHDERGKFAGVEYLISDKVEFLPLAENPHTENPHTENPYTGNQQLINTNKQKTDNNERLIGDSAPVSGELFEVEKTEKKPRKKPATIEQKCLFSDSKFGEFEIFKEQFQGPDYADVDLFYYFNRIMNWSLSGANKKNDWIHTARDWMMRDNDDGKLKKIKRDGYGDAVLSPEAIKYLEMGRL